MIMTYETTDLTADVPIKLNGITSRNPIDAIKTCISSSEIDIMDFFKAWPLPYSVMAERIRRAGLRITANRIKAIMEGDLMNDLEKYMLKILSLEMRNDIEKITI